jgi:uncharacterized protein YgiB involved in biofilm formation
MVARTKEDPPMKKSRSIRLALLGSASLALVACGDDGAPPQDAKFFANVQDCSAVYDEAACRTAKAEADRTLVAEAPRFTRKEECEAQFGAGNCETRQEASGGGSFFMPLLMGYMMGNMLSGPSRYSAPVYRGPDNTAMTQGKGGSLYNVGTFAGSGSTASSSSFRPATQVAQVSRGGFGSTGTAFRSSAGS